ncbi:putative reverse transcriptase domain-containing protein [Tanacetum coccineum]
MMLEEFCPEEEISRMEDELRNLRLRDNDIASYTNRFNKLVLLCPEVVPSTKKKISQYIKGLPSYIQGETYSSKPTTLNEAIRMAHGLMEQKIQGGRNELAKQEKMGRNGGARAMTQAQGENVNQGGHAPKCNRCNMFHFGNCPMKCNKCGKRGHIARDCRGKGVATGANTEPIRVCYKCGDPNHLANSELCPEKKKQDGRNASGHVYAVKDVDQAQGPNVVTELGAFDVIIGMDWLADNDAVIICGKKEVHIPIKNRTLVVKGDRNSSRLKVISCIKARKYIERGCHLFLAHVTEKEKSEKRLEDVPVIHDFPEVFPDDLPGLPPSRQVEFKIDLVPGAAPVARAPYRLAPVMDLDETSLQAVSLINSIESLTTLINLLQDQSVQFLGHVINREGVHVDPAKIEAVKNWPIPKSPTENKRFKWGADEDEAFQKLKQDLCTAPILALPEGPDDFIVYCDASLKGYGSVLIQWDKTLETLPLWKVREKPLRVRSLVMSTYTDLSERILKAQLEAMKQENVKAENLG